MGKEELTEELENIFKALQKFFDDNYVKTQNNKKSLTAFSNPSNNPPQIIDMTPDRITEYTHSAKDGIYDKVADALEELWRNEKKYQDKLRKAVNIYQEYSNLEVELYTKYGVAKVEGRKYPIPTTEDLSIREIEIKNINKKWEAVRKYYHKDSIAGAVFSEHQKIAYDLRVNVVRNGTLQLDETITQLEKNLINLRQQKTELVISGRINVKDIEDNVKKLEQIVTGHAEHARKALNRTDSQIVREVMDFGDRFKKDLGTVENQVYNAKKEIQEVKKEENHSGKLPSEDKIDGLTGQIESCKEKFETTVIAEVEMLHDPTKTNAIINRFDIARQNIASEKTFDKQIRTTVSENTPEHKRVDTEVPQPSVTVKKIAPVPTLQSNLDAVMSSSKLRENDGDVNKKKTRTRVVDEIQVDGANSESLNSAQKSDTENETVADGSVLETNDSEMVNEKERRGILQRFKNVFKPHNGIRLFRFFVHLWPLATWPLCTMWVAFFLPGPFLIMYGLPATLFLYGVINLSFYLPKLVTFAMNIVKQRRLKARNRELERGIRRERNLYTKEQHLAKEKNPEHQRKGKQNEQAHTIESKTLLGGMLAFCKRNWSFLLVAIGLSTLIGSLAVLLMPAILGPIVTPFLITGAFTFGTVVMGITAFSIATQFFDKFFLERVQNNYQDKEKAHINLEKTLDRNTIGDKYRVLVREEPLEQMGGQRVIESEPSHQESSPRVPWIKDGNYLKFDNQIDSDITTTADIHIPKKSFLRDSVGGSRSPGTHLEIRKDSSYPFKENAVMSHGLTDVHMGKVERSISLKNKPLISFNAKKENAQLVSQENAQSSSTEQLQKKRESLTK